MTLENCKIYLKEAKSDVEKQFWEDRINKKYPTVKEKVVKKVVKKEVKE